MTRLVCLGLAALLAAGCASKLRPVQGQSAQEVERDEAECAEFARATAQGEAGTWWRSWVSGGPALGALPILLIAPLTTYIVTRERSVGDITENCMLMRGYKLPEKVPPP